MLTLTLIGRLFRCDGKIEYLTKETKGFIPAKESDYKLGASEIAGFQISKEKTLIKNILGPRDIKFRKKAIEFEPNIYYYLIKPSTEAVGFMVYSIENNIELTKVIGEIYDSTIH